MQLAIHTDDYGEWPTEAGLVLQIVILVEMDVMVAMVAMVVMVVMVRSLGLVSRTSFTLRTVD